MPESCESQRSPHRVWAIDAILHKWTSLVTVGAEHAAVAGLWFQDRPAGGAPVRNHTSIGGHGFFARGIACRTGHFHAHVSHVPRPIPQPKSSTSVAAC